MRICSTCQLKNTPWANICAGCQAALSPASQSFASMGIEPWSPPWAQTQKNTQAIAGSAPDTLWLDIDKVDTDALLADTVAVEQSGELEEPAYASTYSPASSSQMPIFAATTRGVYLADDDAFGQFTAEGPAQRRHRWSQRLAMILICLAIIAAGVWTIRYVHQTASAGPESVRPIARTQPQLPVAAPIEAKVQPPSDSTRIIRREDYSNIVLERGGDSKAGSESELTSETTATKPLPVFVRSASESASSQPVAELSTSIQGTIRPSRTLEPPATNKSSRVAAKYPDIKPVGPRIERPTIYPVLVPVPSLDTNNARNFNDTQAALSASAVLQLQSDVSTPSRLTANQTRDCSNTAFLGKVFCEEKSRLSFCKGRWNEHPDCMVATNRLEP